MGRGCWFWFTSWCEETFLIVSGEEEKEGGWEIVFGYTSKSVAAQEVTGRIIRAWEGLRE